MNIFVKCAIFAGVEVALLAATAICLKKKGLAVEIEKYDFNKHDPLAQFQNNSKLAKEYLGKNNGTPSEPHPNPNVQALIELNDEEYVRLYEEIQMRHEEWTKNGRIDNKKRYAIRIRSVSSLNDKDYLSDVDFADIVKKIETEHRLDKEQLCKKYIDKMLEEIRELVTR